MLINVDLTCEMPTVPISWGEHGLRNPYKICVNPVNLVQKNRLELA